MAGVPEEPITLGVRAGDYVLSQENVSLSPLEGHELLGKADSQALDLEIVLIKPGVEEARPGGILNDRIRQLKGATLEGVK